MPAPANANEYLAALPADRRAPMSRVREVILENLPKGYAEGIQYGMIGYFVPHALYPAGYHANPREPLPFLALGSKKGHMGLYLMSMYGNTELRTWLETKWKKAGKKLDMGGSCLRFRSLDELALDVVGELVAKVPVDALIRGYEAAIPAARRAKSKPAKVSSRRPRARP